MISLNIAIKQRVAKFLGRQLSKELRVPRDCTRGDLLILRPRRRWCHDIRAQTKMRAGITWTLSLGGVMSRGLTALRSSTCS